MKLNWSAHAPSLAHVFLQHVMPCSSVHCLHVFLTILKFFQYNCAHMFSSMKSLDNRCTYRHCFSPACHKPWTAYRIDSISPGPLLSSPLLVHSICTKITTTPFLVLPHTLLRGCHVSEKPSRAPTATPRANNSRSVCGDAIRANRLQGIPAARTPAIPGWLLCNLGTGMCAS